MLNVVKCFKQTASLLHNGGKCTIAAKRGKIHILIGRIENVYVVIKYRTSFRIWGTNYSGQ